MTNKLKVILILITVGPHQLNSCQNFNLHKEINNKQTNSIALSADGCRVLMVIDNPHDQALFQEDLNNLWTWIKLNRLWILILRNGIV